jgi:predicted double-glycine peptidase
VISGFPRRAGVAAFLWTAAAGAWLDVPFVQQDKAGCGPASAAMVMQYWAKRLPEVSTLAGNAERVARLPVPKKGITGNELRRVLESQGFTVFVFNAEQSDLQAQVDKGRPLIVCFAPEGKNGPMHYAVVSGMEENAVLLNDPTRGKLFRESLARFLPQWGVTRNWAMLAVPRTNP